MRGRLHKKNCILHEQIPHNRQRKTAVDRDKAIVEDKDAIDEGNEIVLVANCVDNSSNNGYLRQANPHRYHWRNPRLLDHPRTPRKFG